MYVRFITFYYYLCEVSYSRAYERSRESQRERSRERRPERSRERGPERASEGGREGVCVKERESERQRVMPATSKM